MKAPVLFGAAAVVLAGALLSVAAPPVQDVLAANTWLVPMPRIDVFMGPIETPSGGDDPEGPDGPDPPPPPAVYRTITEIVESPERIEKGDSFVVTGKVTTALGGEPVANALVDLYLNETKDSPGLRVAKNRTDVNGVFRIAATVPPFLEARGYQVVASAHDTLNGRQLFLESWSDPPTAVYSATRLQARHPTTAAVATPVVFEGEILDVLGNPVRGAGIHLVIDDDVVATRFSDDTGYFRFEHEFSEPGRHRVEVRYDGSTYYYPSAYHGEILIGGVGLSIQGDNAVTRGEELQVAGAVVGEPDRIAGVTVTVEFENLTFDGESTFQYRSNPSGEWGGKLTVHPDTEPGERRVRYTATSLGIEEERTVRVLARTSLVLEAPATLEHDAKLVATATLVDDKDTPLAARTVEIAAGDATQRGFTDENGTVTFELAVPSGDHRLRATFGGDRFHRASAAVQPLHVEAPLLERALPWLLALLALAVLAVLVAWLLRPSGRRAVQRAAAALDPRRPVALAIDLPQVETDLPDVWGVGDPLLVEARASLPDGPPLAGLPLALEAGGEVAATTDETGAFRHTVTVPEEGVLELVLRYRGDAQRRPTEVRRPVRVVQYRRVIEEGFVELRRDLAAVGVPVHDATPPRELERRLAAAVPDLAQADLDRLLTLFEVSDYSEHPIGRDEWITFHRTRRALERAMPARAEVAAVA